MSAQGKFIIFCAEQYKAAKHLTGKQLSELFGKYHVWEYLYSCFEALHTTGTNYIIEDIDLYIRKNNNCLFSDSGCKKHYTTFFDKNLHK